MLLTRSTCEHPGRCVHAVVSERNQICLTTVSAALLLRMHSVLDNPPVTPTAEHILYAIVRILLQLYVDVLKDRIKVIVAHASALHNKQFCRVDERQRVIDLT